MCKVELGVRRNFIINVYLLFICSLWCAQSTSAFLLETRLEIDYSVLHIYMDASTLICSYSS